MKADLEKKKKVLMGILEMLTEVPSPEMDEYVKDKKAKKGLSILEIEIEPKKKD